MLFLQKGLPTGKKYGIVIKGFSQRTLFIEQLAADVREAGENPAQFRYRVGERHADATGTICSGKAHGTR